MVIAVDSISFQLPITQLPISDQVDTQTFFVHYPLNRHFVNIHGTYFPSVRQLHRRGLLPGAGVPRPEVAGAAVAPAGAPEQRQLLGARVEEAHGALVQAAPQADAGRVARAAAGVLPARPRHLLDRPLPLRLEQPRLLPRARARLVRLRLRHSLHRSGETISLAQNDGLLLLLLFNNLFRIKILSVGLLLPLNNCL